MSFNLNEEKMLCLMVLDDSLAKRLSEKAGHAYWRAFILENRTTHRVYAQYRFRYEDDERSWFQIQPREQESLEVAIARLRCGLEDVIRTGLAVFGVEASMIENAIHCYYPPDDQGDPLKTIVWLEEQDLVEIKVERKE